MTVFKSKCVTEKGFRTAAFNPSEHHSVLTWKKESSSWLEDHSPSTFLQFRMNYIPQRHPPRVEIFPEVYQPPSLLVIV